MKLFPQPRKISLSPKRTNCNRITDIELDPCFSPVLSKAVQLFFARFRSVFSNKLQIGNLSSNNNSIKLTLNPSIKKTNSYKLIISSEDIQIKAKDEPGAFYGLQTLGQIFDEYGSLVPLCVVDDYPDFPNRGIMLDISRCKVPKISEIKKNIDLFASLKLNQLQLYTEHTFAFSMHSTVWDGASPLTADDIRELDIYCNDRYIELVPNFNSFGHFERWLRHSAYKHLADSPYGFDHPLGGHSDYGSTLKPNKASIKFLDLLYGEFLPNFSSRYFNVGCDETWELGKGWSKKLCDKKGTTRVYLDFLKKIHKLTAKYGRQMMFWGDIILKEPELIHELPKDLIALCWGYEKNHPFNKQCAQLAQSGIEFYVCPGTSSWNSLTGRTENCLKNLANASRNGNKHGATGYLITDWGDHGHHQYWPISLPGIFAGAAYGWCYKANAKRDIVSEVNKIAFKDTVKKTGKLIYDLGRTPELVPIKLTNKTIFNLLLFSKPKDLKKNLKGITVNTLNKSIKRFDLLQKSIAQISPGTSDSTLIRAELTNAVRMARFGAKRGLVGLGTIRNTQSMRNELKEIISQHKKLWRERNRFGGLEESSGKLEKILEYL